MTEPLPSGDEIRTAIQDLRGMRVVLDEDLARFYGKSVSAFNQAAKRNAPRFEGYRFRLSDAEVAALQSRNVIAKPKGRGGRRSNPWVYNDYGVVIASTLFNDDRAVAITRMLTEAFVDAAALPVETPRRPAELLPPEPQGRAGLPLPSGTELRALAESILESGERGLLDWIRSPTTERQQAVAATMKTLAETSGVEARNDLERLRLSVARRIADGDWRDDADRATLLDLLHALKG